MRSPHRTYLACILIALSTFLVGCGGDDEEDTSPTTVFSPSATTGVAGTPTTGVATPTSDPSGVVRNVTDGSPCPTQGARGITAQGLNVICTTVGGEPRWRPA